MKRVGQNVLARMGVTKLDTMRQSTFLIVLRMLDSIAIVFYSYETTVNVCIHAQ